MPDQAATQAALDALRDYYRSARVKNTWQRMDESHLDLPLVPPPSIFQPDPPAVGSPEFARSARTLLDLDPYTKARVSKIVNGPTRGSMDEMIRSGLSPERFGGTTLLGVYGLRDRQIGINETLSDPTPTLVHEIAHAAGWGEGGAEKAEKIYPPRLSRDALNELVKQLAAKGIKAVVGP